MDYKKLNNYVGWMVFIFATVVYCMTIEPTTSLWDCGEYITTSYKLEVGHPPGAPLYMMMGRLFSMLFLFWTITAIAKRVVLHPEVKLFGGNAEETLDAAGKKKVEFTDGSGRKKTLKVETFTWEKLDYVSKIKKAFKL